MIPDKSVTSLKKGNWFIYNEGSNTIQIWSSNFNGKEIVYLNGILVSEIRSMKLKTVHAFKDKNGVDYEVNFITENLLKGILRCQVIKDTEVVKIFKTKYKRGKNFTFKRFFLLILAAIIYAVFESVNNFPDFVFLIFMSLVLVIHFFTRDHGEILLEENTE